MINEYIGVGIIGCGLIGTKRAHALGEDARLVACADTNIERANILAQGKNTKCFTDWQKLLCLPEVDLVIIAAYPYLLPTIILAAVRAGKHVLVEKPAACSAEEIRLLIEAIGQTNKKIRVGFNHRYHRSLLKAKEIVDNGEIGELMYVRARYGHGGRIGYQNEWRADQKLSGGGELIDQGSHVIDLARWFLGEFVEINGSAHTYYWDMPVDDNCFMLLKTQEKQSAFLHVSCTEWKNLFSMEIYGKKGKLDLHGLGRSYGVEKLTYYKMLPQMGPPETISWEYPMEDDSWQVELKEFLYDIRHDRVPSVGLEDAYAVLKIIGEIYQGSGYDYCS